MNANERPLFVFCVVSKRKAPRAATGAQARPAREIRRRCACLPRARLFLVVGSRAADFSGGGARLAHRKQARRATRTAGAASCVAALVGLGRAAFRRSFSSLIAHRGPICVVLITAHWGLAPLTRGRGYKAPLVFQTPHLCILEVAHTTKATSLYHRDQRSAIYHTRHFGYSTHSTFVY